MDRKNERKCCVYFLPLKTPDSREKQKPEVRLMKKNKFK